MQARPVRQKANSIWQQSQRRWRKQASLCVRQQFEDPVHNICLDLTLSCVNLVQNETKMAAKRPQEEIVQ